MALLVILALAILVLPCLRPVLVTPEQMRLPDGYTDVVNALFRAGVLLPTADGLDISLPPDPKSPFARAVRAFDRGSFLNTDRRIVDPALWDAKGIQRSAHRVVGPFENLTPWKGSILFQPLSGVLKPKGPRPETAAAGKPRLILVDEVSGRQYPLGLGDDLSMSQGATPIDLSVKISNEAGQKAPETRRIAFLLNRPERPEVDLLLVGNKVVLRFFSGASGERWRPFGDIMAINGQRLKWSAAQDFVDGYHVLQVEDTITFATEDGSRRQFRLVQRAPAISRYRLRAGRDRADGLESFAAPVETAMGEGEDNVQTSLVAELQAPAQAALRAVGRSVLNRNDPNGGFRAAAVLMDGMTGEILALPTFPSSPDDLPKAVDVAKAQRLLASNSNFIRMPIGSAAKAPFATAIAQRYPVLLDLNITEPMKPEMSCVLGRPLGGTVDSETHEAVDFKHFLGWSSNKYAFSLMLLGLARPTGDDRVFFSTPQSDWVRICGDRDQYGYDARRSLSTRPPFGARVGPSQQGLWENISGPIEATGDEWSSNLGTLFCLSSGKTPIKDGARCRSSLWPNPPAFERAAGRSEPLQLDPELFGFNEIGDLLSDYLMSILGGNRSRWSTIRLAQTYARIVTNTAVNARLTPVGPADPAAVALGIRPQVHGAVLQGMQAVLAPDGTAKSLKLADEDLHDGTFLRYFAKTGTPNVVRIGIQAPANKQLQDFAKLPCGLRAIRDTRADDGRLRLIVGESGDVAEEIRKTPGCARFLPDAAALSQEIKAINGNATLRDDIDVGNDGRVIAVPWRSNAGKEEAPKGRVLALVVGRYSRVDGAFSKPCSVSVAVVNFQRRNGDSQGGDSPHIRYIQALVDDPVIKAWFRRAAPACETARRS